LNKTIVVDLFLILFTDFLRLFE